MPHPQSPDPSASPVKTEQPPLPQKGGWGELDATEPAADGCIQIEYSSDKLFCTNIYAVPQNYLYKLG